MGKKEELKKKIQENIRKRNNSEVTIFLNEYIEKYKDDAWGYERLSYQEMKIRKNYANAVKIAEEGLVKAPDSFYLRMTYATSLSFLHGEEKKSESLFRRLLKDGPDAYQKSKAAMAYADFLVRKYRYKDAIRIYRIILKHDPDDKIARFDLARAYRMSGEYELCLEMLNEHPLVDDPYWHREVSSCLVELGRPDDALGHLQTAKLLAQEWPKFAIDSIRNSFIVQIDFLEGSANALNGEWKESIELVLRSKDKGNFQVVVRSIIKYILNNNMQDIAIKYLLEKIREYKNSFIIGSLIDRFIVSCEFDNDYIDEVLAKLFELDGKNIYSYIIMARHKKDENYKQALSYLDKGFDLAEESQKKYGFGTAVFQLARLNASILRQVDRCEDAIILLEGVRAKFNVTSWELDLEKAMSLIIVGSYPEAFDILYPLSKTENDNPVVLDQLAICLRLMGRFKEAKDVYGKKTELFPDDIQGWYGLAKTLFDLGEHVEAKRILNNILSSNDGDIEAKILMAQILRQDEEFKEAQDLLTGINAFDVLQGENCNLKYQRKLVELEKQKEKQQIQLEEAKKLGYLGTMATALAHEINQPIGVIRAATSGAMEDIKDGLFKEDEVAPLLDSIWAQTERLYSIIDSFRRFSRGDRANREKVDINDVVSHVHGMFEEQFKIRGIALKCQLWKKTSKPAIAWANFYQLEEVLINLVTNARDAVKHTPLPTIRLSVWKRRDGGACFSVEDNGPGLPDDCLKNLFMPFYSTKSTEEGTGLGLYISRRIIDSLGGQLSYKSRDNGGATFGVTFPPIRG